MWLYQVPCQRFFRPVQGIVIGTDRIKTDYIVFITEFLLPRTPEEPPESEEGDRQAMTVKQRMSCNTLLSIDVSAYYVILDIFEFRRLHWTKSLPAKIQIL
jgi:hypothetical protein